MLERVTDALTRVPESFEVHPKLAKLLEASGVTHVTLKEYLDVEHIMTVRESLPDCFAMFDKVAKK